MIPEEIILHIYTFLYKHPCRSHHIILNRRFNEIHGYQTRLCDFRHFYGLEFCRHHKNIRTLSNNKTMFLPGCAIH